MSKTVRFWDRIAKDYDNPVEPDSTTYIMVEHAIKLLSSEHLVLDFACGTGTITNEIAGHVKEIHALHNKQTLDLLFMKFFLKPVGSAFNFSSRNLEFLCYCSWFQLALLFMDLNVYNINCGKNASVL